MAPVHHYEISLAGALVAGAGDPGRRRGPGPVQVRRHTFAEAQAEASRVLGALRARGYEVQEGLGLWQSSVRGEVPAGQSRAAGREELARVAIDDIGILDCDGRCQAEIDLGAGPGAADGGGPSPRP